MYEPLLIQKIITTLAVIVECSSKIYFNLFIVSLLLEQDFC